MRKITAHVLVIAFCAGTLAVGAEATDERLRTHWVSAWGAAVQAPIIAPGLPPLTAFNDQTVRMVVRPSIGGKRIRVRFSNAFGTSTLEFGAVHVALTQHGASIVANSDRVLTFDGAGSVKIPQGAPLLSDPVDLDMSPFAELSISIYLPEQTGGTTTHVLAQHESYIAGPGDLTSKTDLPNATVSPSWLWLADVEVSASDQSGAVVAFGDSITDGAGAKVGEYNDWPDQLAKRLATDDAPPTLAVLNEGIGGNRILHDVAGVNALARFDRDVLAHPGVLDLIVLEGINDIGWPNMRLGTSKDGAAKTSPFAHQVVTAKDLIGGLRQIIERAHEHGIRVFGATLTPYEGSSNFSQDGESTRRELNDWIRTSGAFDGVIDFDAAVRDPARPSFFREEFQSGDHLHPSPAGYEAMTSAIRLADLRRAR